MLENLRDQIATMATSAYWNTFYFAKGKPADSLVDDEIKKYTDTLGAVVAPAQTLCFITYGNGDPAKPVPKAQTKYDCEQAGLAAKQVRADANSQWLGA